MLGRMKLTSRQRHVLRGMGHHLNPLVRVGHQGLSPELLAECSRALEAHELIKVRLGGEGVERHDQAEELAGLLHASVVQVVGKVVLLFKRNAQHPRLELPEAGPGDRPPRPGVTFSDADVGAQAAATDGDDDDTGEVEETASDTDSEQEDAVQGTSKPSRKPPKKTGGRKKAPAAKKAAAKKKAPAKKAPARKAPAKKKAAAKKPAAKKKKPASKKK